MTVITGQMLVALDCCSRSDLITRGKRIVN